MHPLTCCWRKQGLFAVRKTKFAEFPALEEDLDLVDADDQITHELSLDEQLDPEPVCSLPLLFSLSSPWVCSGCLLGFEGWRTRAFV